MSFRSPVIKLARSPSFLIGVMLGLVTVVPKVLLQFGIEIGSAGEGWWSFAGPVAYCVMFVAMWLVGSWVVYLLLAAGVIANGLALAGIVWTIRTAMRGVKP